MSGKPPVPDESNLRIIVDAVRSLFFGRSLATGQVTLTINVGSTTVNNDNVGADSEIFLTPRHANAATEIGNGTAYISAVSRGSFTVTHANSATANRTFGYRIDG